MQKVVILTILTLLGCGNESIDYRSLLNEISSTQHALPVELEGLNFVTAPNNVHPAELDGAVAELLALSNRGYELFLGEVIWLPEITIVFVAQAHWQIFLARTNLAANVAGACSGKYIFLPFDDSVRVSSKDSYDAHRSLVVLNHERAHCQWAVSSEIPAKWAEFFATYYVAQELGYNELLVDLLEIYLEEQNPYGQSRRIGWQVAAGSGLNPGEVFYKLLETTETSEGDWCQFIDYLSKQSYPFEGEFVEKVKQWILAEKAEC